jgi:hypothetical protein
MLQHSLTDVLSINEPNMIYGFIIAQPLSSSIYWTGDWAYSCDFNNSDLTNV